MPDSRFLFLFIFIYLFFNFFFYFILITQRWRYSVEVKSLAYCDIVDFKTPSSILFLFTQRMLKAFYFDSVITALHVMQTRYSDENSVRLFVCLSVRPSVCLSHA